MGRTIRESFEQAKASGQIALVPFIPAGYPDLAATPAALAACDRAGASVIEVGFPFSDPIADGPVIQEAFTKALARHIKVADIFAAVKAVQGGLTAPLVAMVSYSIVFRYGVERFLSEAKAAGFAGLIIPDLPPPEAAGVCQKTQAAGLDTILLIAPTTSPQRRAEIVKLCSGFVYYLSVSGVTGERDKLPSDLVANVRQIKSLTTLPICVGFGIHLRQQVQELARTADGAIVGSAIVRRMTEAAAGGTEAVAAAVSGLLRELMGQAEKRR